MNTDREDIENTLKLHKEISAILKGHKIEEVTGALTIAIKDSMNKFYYQLIVNNNQTKEGAKRNVELLLETIKETVIENLEEFEI